MKIITENVIVNQGAFSSSNIIQTINNQIREGILSVTWGGSDQFIINPIRKGNGVLPIKNNFIAHLVNNGWESEVSMSLINDLNPGPIDAVYRSTDGLIAVEWETGNISSSHRALNKLALGILQNRLKAGFLVLPMRELARYLTDRIGNYEEIAPYFPMYENLQIRDGVIGIFGVSYDETSSEVTLIPKGNDGNAFRATSSTD